MNAPVDDRMAVWDAFLQRWPLASLPGLTLDQYNKAGDPDCFTQWLEAKTQELGSIWGGSSFKFGVYSRKDQADKPSGQGRSFTPTHAWASKYGETAEQAFATVRDIVVGVAQAARRGDLATIETADLGDVTKWKIAFLYQDRAAPCVLHIYRRGSLQSLLDTKEPLSCAALHAQLMAKRGTTELLAYGDQLLARIEEIESAKLSTAEARDYLEGEDRFEQTKPASEFMTGFRTATGLELALALDNKMPTLYLSPGPWLDTVKGQLSGVVQYPADKSRTGSIATHAPALAPGHAMVKVTVPTMAALHALCNAYDESEPPAGAAPQTLPPQPDPAMPPPPLNQILFGPPGTGKTFETIDRALEILDAPFLAANKDDRAALRRRFAEFEKDKRVRFTTFHQSFSYEDFVEGIRASVQGDAEAAASGVSYVIERGVFAELCHDARRDKQMEQQVGIRDGATVWKLSIEGTASAGKTRQHCLSHDEARIGWSETGDLRQVDLTSPELKLGSKDRQSLEHFSQGIVVGDVVLCLASRTTIGAVGVVTGEYQYTPDVPEDVRDDYVHKLPVRWLATGLEFDILALNKGTGLTQQTVYPLRRLNWPELQDALTAAGVALSIPSQAVKPIHEPYVLIIDEINRGNVSRIFGELITLIEPSKRAGADEALEAILPYSKKAFSVPGNVYLIGTMNTADRSLAGLDVALRRRFTFREMPPRPELLEGVEVQGVPIGKLLSVLNQRIEALLDREHCLGHAYFLPLRDEASLGRLAAIFRNQILPLLQEYFFEDWQRIQWVLNDHRKVSPMHRFIVEEPWSAKALFGDEVTVSSSRKAWRVNGDAFGLAESYQSVIEHKP